MNNALNHSVAAVIFDFGGVLCDDPFKTMGSVAVEHGFDFREFAAIAIGHGDYGGGDHPWHQLERGEIDLVEYERDVDLLAKGRGHDGFPPLPVDRILAEAVAVRPAMLELLADLRAQGIATAILTNNVRALGSWRDSADWSELVDVVIDSCEVGMRKPERRIFDHACAALGVGPDVTLFLDDMRANIDGATDAGLASILVTDPDEAIRTVRQRISG